MHRGEKIVEVYHFERKMVPRDYVGGRNTRWSNFTPSGATTFIHNHFRFFYVGTAIYLIKGDDVRCLIAEQMDPFIAKMKEKLKTAPDTAVHRMAVCREEFKGALPVGICYEMSSIGAHTVQEFLRECKIRTDKMLYYTPSYDHTTVWAYPLSIIATIGREVKDV
jgi:hypothetical protein